MTLTPASPPSPNPDLPTTTPTTTTTTTNPENLHAPSTTAMPTQSESDEPLNWERPRTPTKRAFFTPVTQFFSSKRQKVNFDQDTEYHAPSKEKKNGILAGGVGGATAGLATSSGRSNGVGFQERFDNLMPAHRTYLGRSRKVFLIGVGIIFLCLLALILGLGIGLSKKNSYVDFFSSLYSVIMTQPEQPNQTSLENLQEYFESYLTNLLIKAPTNHFHSPLPQQFKLAI